MLGLGTICPDVAAIRPLLTFIFLLVRQCEDYLPRRDKSSQMTQAVENQKGALDRAIATAEAALAECDEHGFIYAAIDISSALDKLRVLRMRLIENDCR